MVPKAVKQHWLLVTDTCSKYCRNGSDKESKKFYRSLTLCLSLSHSFSPSPPLSLTNTNTPKHPPSSYRFLSNFLLLLLLLHLSVFFLFIFFSLSFPIFLPSHLLPLARDSYPFSLYLARSLPLSYFLFPSLSICFLFIIFNFLNVKFTFMCVLKNNVISNCWYLSKKVFFLSPSQYLSLTLSV